MIALLRSLAVIGGLIVAAAVATPASADGYATTNGAVNMRKGPGTGYAVIATIPAGARLWIDFCQPKWCKAVWQKKKGWVAAGLLNRIYSGPAPVYDYDIYDYEYWYGFDYGYPYYWPHRPWPPRPPKPPHCKPGHECPPPPPPPCKGKSCWPKPDKPWPKSGKPWNKPPKFQGPVGDGSPKAFRRMGNDVPQFGGGNIGGSGDFERGSDGPRFGGGGGKPRGRIWIEE